MPVINRAAAIADEAAVWRRDFHENPEIGFEVHRTAAVVAEKLKEFGVDEIATGIGRTGVVGVIRGKKPGKGRTIGLRADMDALPLQEETGLPHASKIPGKMHACGHDGHTAILLGAAKYLAETRNFAGTAVVMFQPAEEEGGGGREMVEDGVMDRFGVDEVYGMHNQPMIGLGKWAIRPGPLMAAADTFEVKLTGKGAHAARPHQSIDPVVAAGHLIVALQTIASRNADPLDAIVVSVTAVETGKAFNIIPQTAVFRGTVRTLSQAAQDLAARRIPAIVGEIAAAYQCKADVSYKPGYPITINHDRQTETAIAIAREVSGEANVTTDTPPLMGAEDFSFMLNARPGAYIFIGNGDSAGVHNPAYEFNDAAIPFGVSYFARLVETATEAR